MSHFFFYKSFITNFEIMFVPNPSDESTSQTISNLTRVFSLNDLPDEILLKLFSYLGPKDLGRCLQVSKRFNRIAKDESIPNAALLGPLSPSAMSIWCGQRTCLVEIVDREPSWLRVWRDCRASWRRWYANTLDRLRK